MTHPIDLVLVDNTPTSKAALRDWERLAFFATSVSQVSATNMTSTLLVVLSTATGQACYVLDPDDLSTPTDASVPPLTLIDLAGRRFKRPADVASGVTATLIGSLLSAAGGLAPEDIAPSAGAREILATGDTLETGFVSLTTLVAWLDDFIGSTAWRNVTSVAASPDSVAIRPRYFDGSSNSVAIFADGTLRVAGEKGDSLTPTSLKDYVSFTAVPVELNPGEAYPTFTQVEGTCGSAYALDSTGKVFAWGLNSYGQLGDGGTTARRAARRIQWLIANGITVHEIIPAYDGNADSAGCYFIGSTSSITRGLWYCGHNLRGQAGDGTSTNRLTPVRCGTLTNISWMAVGPQYSGCSAFARVGTSLYAWGHNGNGSYGLLGLGLGVLANQTSPQLHPLSNVTKVAGGSGMTLFILSDRTIRTSGYNGHYGLGNGTTTHSNGALVNPGLSNVVDATVNASDSNLCSSVFVIENPSGTVRNLKRWGYNGRGQMADGSTTVLTTPTAVTETWQGSVDEVKFGGSGNGYHFPVVRVGNDLYTCGYGGQGQTGSGVNIADQQKAFTKVLGVRGSIESYLPAGQQQYGRLTVLTSRGLLVCGYNVHGELGIGSIGNEWSLVDADVICEAQGSANGSLSGWTEVALANGLNSAIQTLAIASRLRISGPTAAFSLGGLTGGSGGRMLKIYNPLNFTMTIVNEDASAAAVDRIRTLSGSNLVLRANAPSFVTLAYDEAMSRWVVESYN